jgi:hypothetical protein
MLLTAAILNSIGGLAILAGAGFQAKAAYRQHEREQSQQDVKIWVDRDGYLVPRSSWNIPFSDEELERTRQGTWAYVSQRDVTFEGGPLPFLPSIRTIREHQATFVGWFGWQLVFVGGALVLAGPIIAAVASV